MQLQSTASRVVWRKEENVRWTSLNTDVLWLHEIVEAGNV